MALSFRLSGDVLEVVESLFSWSDTKTTYWYYDIANWTVSSFGRKGDKPDRPMTEGSKSWVRKYYLPKVGIHTSIIDNTGRSPNEPGHS